MSTRKNTHTTRPYRERPTPHSLTKRHLTLPKHRDYTLRAADHNLKKSKLRLLRQKAAQRNEDEFSFGMLKTVKAREREGVGDGRGVLKGEGVLKRRGGVDKGEERGMGEARVRLLKTQDVGYLRTRLSHVRKERQKLEQAILVTEKDPRKVEEEGQGIKILGAKDGGGRAEHVVFVDEEAEQKVFRPEEHFHTDEKGVRRAWNRPRVLPPPSSTTNDPASSNNDPDPSQHKPHPHALLKAQQAERTRRDESRRKQALQERLQRKLEGLRTQERELEAAERELQEQRDRMAGNVGGVNGEGVRFKVRERKR